MAYPPTSPPPLGSCSEDEDFGNFETVLNNRREDATENCVIDKNTLNISNLSFPSTFSNSPSPLPSERYNDRSPGNEFLPPPLSISPDFCGQFTEFTTSHLPVGSWTASKNIGSGDELDLFAEFSSFTTSVSTMESEDLKIPPGVSNELVTGPPQDEIGVYTNSDRESTDGIALNEQTSDHKVEQASDCNSDMTSNISDGFNTEPKHQEATLVPDFGVTFNKSLTTTELSSTINDGNCMKSVFSWDSFEDSNSHSVSSLNDMDTNDSLSQINILNNAFSSIAIDHDQTTPTNSDNSSDLSSSDKESANVESSFPVDFTLFNNPSPEISSKEYNVNEDHADTKILSKNIPEEEKLNESTEYNTPRIHSDATASEKDDDRSSTHSKGSTADSITNSDQIDLFSGRVINVPDQQGEFQTFATEINKQPNDALSPGCRFEDFAGFIKERDLPDISDSFTSSLNVFTDNNVFHEFSSDQKIIKDEVDFSEFSFDPEFGSVEKYDTPNDDDDHDDFAEFEPLEDSKTHSTVTPAVAENLFVDKGPNESLQSGSTCSENFAGFIKDSEVSNTFKADNNEISSDDEFDDFSSGQNIIHKRDFAEFSFNPDFSEFGSVEKYDTPNDDDDDDFAEFEPVEDSKTHSTFTPAVTEPIMLGRALSTCFQYRNIISSEDHPDIYMDGKKIMFIVNEIDHSFAVSTKWGSSPLYCRMLTTLCLSSNHSAVTSNKGPVPFKDEFDVFGAVDTLDSKLLLASESSLADNSNAAPYKHTEHADIMSAYDTNPTHKLSKEARDIVNSLPDLEFMLAPVLMFPVKG